MEVSKTSTNSWCDIYCCLPVGGGGGGFGAMSSTPRRDFVVRELNSLIETRDNREHCHNVPKCCQEHRGHRRGARDADRTQERTVGCQRWKRSLGRYWTRLDLSFSATWTSTSGRRERLTLHLEQLLLPRLLSSYSLTRSFPSLCRMFFLGFKERDCRRTTARCLWHTDSITCCVLQM